MTNGNRRPPLQRWVEFAPGLCAHAGRALWIPAASALLVADPHLGYTAAQRRRGQLGPVVEGDTRLRLLALLDELQPATVVLLGDVVHAPNPAPVEHRWIESTLDALSARARLVLVRGNHDRGFATRPMVASWHAPGVTAVHGDRIPPTNDLLVLGHWHPVLTVRDAAGAPQRLPVFAITPVACILPAFSPFAAGLDLRRPLPPALQATLGPARPRLIAASGRRAVELPQPRPNAPPAP